VGEAAGSFHCAAEPAGHGFGAPGAHDPGALGRRVPRRESRREAALREFLSRRFHVADLKWVDDKTAPKIIHTLEIMKRQAEEKKAKEAAV
jgi:hypothetical protein